MTHGIWIAGFLLKDAQLFIGGELTSTSGIVSDTKLTFVWPTLPEGAHAVTVQKTILDNQLLLKSDALTVTYVAPVTSVGYGGPFSDMVKYEQKKFAVNSGADWVRYSKFALYSFANMHSGPFTGRALNDLPSIEL